MDWQMKKIIDFIQPFNEFELEVNEFNFKNNNSEDFWDFIKKQNHKGDFLPRNFLLMRGC